MLQFIAFAWPAPDEAASAYARELIAGCRRFRGWHCAIDALGFAVFWQTDQARERPTLFPVGCGVLFGPIFPRPHASDIDPPLRMTLSAQDAHQVIASSGRYLTQECWGDYVAFFRE